MTIRNLEHLFDPSAVALVGASAEPGSVGLWLARNLARGGFAGSVHPVNPHRPMIDGRQALASVAELPGGVDLAVIATPPATIPALIAELGERGTRAAIVVSAGFRADLKQAMLEAARPNLLRILGPNCIGLMVPGEGLDASFSHIAPLKGDRR